MARLRAGERFELREKQTSESLSRVFSFFVVPFIYSLYKTLPSLVCFCAWLPLPRAKWYRTEFLHLLDHPNRKKRTAFLFVKMDEDYDELMGPMGPRPGQNMRQVFEEEPPPLPSSSSSRDPVAPVARTPSKTGPPPTLFHAMPDRWAQHDNNDDAASLNSTGRKPSSIMSFEEEEEDLPSPVTVTTDCKRIRQEALRMLEVADSGPYSVHKTVTGGFMAEPRSMGNGRRVPTALAGLGSFAKKAGRPKKMPTPPIYRDAPSATLEEEYVYGGDDYDDSRFAAQQAKEETKTSSSSWSSRYSVDDTLWAMSGGTVKSPPAPRKSASSFLDKLDTQNERRSARNMFMASPAQESNIFGAGGFSFRAKNVFGKQGVVANDNNLRTVWMDAGASNSPARSWQDNLKDIRKRRRIYLIVAALLCACLVALVAILGARNKSGDIASSTSKTSPQGDEAITFLVTSDIPWNEDEEVQLANELKTISSRAEFLVHLGSVSLKKRNRPFLFFAASHLVSQNVSFTALLF